MASHPTPPTGSLGLPQLALPRQRLPLALPGHGQPRPRNASATSATSSSHPLRQTSFPPPDSLEAQHQAAEDHALAVYSPTEGSLEDFSDSEIVSAISGPADDSASRKRKRGEKRPRGRPKTGGFNGSLRRSFSVATVDEKRKPTTPGANTGVPSVATASGDAEEEDDDGEEDEVAVGGRLPLYEGGQMSQAEILAENQQRAMFSEHIGYVDSLPLSRRKGITVADHSARYEAFGRSKLRVADVRRLVNQTLSQSVPPNIITVVSSYTKLFAGMLIRDAREVQAEWDACEAQRADGADNPMYQQLKRVRHYRDDAADGQAEKPSSPAVQPDSTGDKTSLKQEEDETANFIKREHNSSSPPQQSGEEISSQPSKGPENNGQSSRPSVFPGGAGGLSRALEECDRGPLQPDHLREALRRYKKARQGGTVGFTGLSLEGREVAAPRMGGRRLFR